MSLTQSDSIVDSFFPGPKHLQTDDVVMTTGALIDMTSGEDASSAANDSVIAVAPPPSGHEEQNLPAHNSNEGLANFETREGLKIPAKVRRWFDEQNTQRQGQGLAPLSFQPHQSGQM